MTPGLGLLFIPRQSDRESVKFRPQYLREDAPNSPSWGDPREPATKLSSALCWPELGWRRKQLLVGTPLSVWKNVRFTRSCPSLGFFLNVRARIFLKMLGIYVLSGPCHTVSTIKLTCGHILQLWVNHIVVQLLRSCLMDIALSCTTLWYIFRDFSPLQKSWKVEEICTFNDLQVAITVF